MKNLMKKRENFCKAKIHSPIIRNIKDIFYYGEKNNILAFWVQIISEIICFFIIKININIINNMYAVGINIVQFLYFLPIFMCSLYVFFSKSPNRTIIIRSTIGLIAYSIILHIFIKQIAMLFTNVTGIVNFVEYASKIYFICLPLAGFRILAIKKENTKKAYFLLFIRIILLIIITFIFKNLFGLKGVLYSWSLSELIWFLVSGVILFKNKCI